MIVHAFITHPRDAWCVQFHVETYLRFCDRVVVAIDGGDEKFSRFVRSLSIHVIGIDYSSPMALPESRVGEIGVMCDERGLRQAALDAAMVLKPRLIVFGDTDEVPTPDVDGWIKAIADRPQNEERWYCHWVNLWGDYRHAIGGESRWSFQSVNGNKKCLAMQPGGDMIYPVPHHCPLEPGRISGGPVKTGRGRYLVDVPKLLHLKYGARNWTERPESKLARHHADEMLKNGGVVDVPAEWLPEGMPA